jgi:Phosphotransferase enzyme family
MEVCGHPREGEPVLRTVTGRRWTDMPDVSAVEAALLGGMSRQQIDGWVDRAVRELVGTPVASVRFRAGRIDAVYGVDGADGRSLLVKVHRPPVDVPGRRLAVRAQEILADAGFPCARPLAGPARVGDAMVSVEKLLPDGERGDAHDPRLRASVAEGLARQVALLEPYRDLVDGVGHPPAWCHYRGGAWSSSHDPFFDFTTTPPEYAWLRRYAQDAADAVVAADDAGPRVAAHADWYSGNLRFDGTRITAAFDWDLVADGEAVVAGITAGMFSAGTSGDAGPPTPEDAAGFLADYEAARGIRFTAAQRRVAGAAVRWSIAYTARCDVTLRDGAPPAPGSALDLLATRREDYDELGR